MQDLKMQEIITVIQNDPILMFIGALAVAVLLAIVLVVVISAMRVSVYKKRFKTLLFENKEKAEHITKVEKELQEYKINNTKNKQELAQFDETKIRLKTATDDYLTLQNRFNENEKELAQTMAKLKVTEEMLDALQKEYTLAKERFDVATEENNKYRTTNARLLTKLENEERYAKAVKQQNEAR